jgi:hypothetical protein
VSGGSPGGKKRGGIVNDEIAEGLNPRRVGVRRDTADGDAGDDPGQNVELGGSLSAVEEPVHIGVLYEFEEGFALS